MKTLTMQVEDSLYNIIQSAANEQKKDISNFMEFITMQYILSSQDSSNKTKVYFQESLKEIEEGKTTLLSQAEYEQEMHVFINDLKSKYADSLEIKNISKNFNPLLLL